MATQENASIYNPRRILDHRILSTDEKPSSSANIAAFYNAKHELHLVEKSKFKPGPGQVLVHVKATSICGQASLFYVLDMHQILKTALKEFGCPLLEAW
jgi:L-iditol 2-dehydrogenase